MLFRSLPGFLLRLRGMGRRFSSRSASKSRRRDGYAKATFTSVDGYSSTFSKEEIRTHLLVVAIRANGVSLPLEQGFPARLVAEDIYGGRWVKYLTRIELK